MIKGNSNVPSQLYKVRHILSTFYTEHCTLLQYLQKIDPSKETAFIQDDDLAEYKYLFATTLVAISERDSSKLPFKPSYAHLCTLSEILNRVIENACTCRSTFPSVNVLAFGYEPLTGDNRQGTVTGTTGIQNSYPNTIVSYLRLAKSWQTVHRRVGDDLMVHLLQNVALFIKIPSSSCYLQVAGYPINRLSALSVDLSPRLRRKQATSSLASAACNTTTETGVVRKKARRGGKRQRKSHEKANKETCCFSCGSDESILYNEVNVAACAIKCTDIVEPTENTNSVLAITDDHIKLRSHHSVNSHSGKSDTSVRCKQKRYNHSMCTTKRVKRGYYATKAYPLLGDLNSKSKANVTDKRTFKSTCGKGVKECGLLLNPNGSSQVLLVEGVGGLEDQSQELSSPKSETSKSNKVDADTGEALNFVSRECTEERERLKTSQVTERSKIAKKRKVKDRKSAEGKLAKGKPWDCLRQLLPKSCSLETVLEQRKREKSQKLFSSKESSSRNAGNKVRIPLNEIYIPHHRLMYATNLSQKFPKNHILESVSESSQGARKLIQQIFQASDLRCTSSYGLCNKPHPETDDHSNKGVKGTAGHDTENYVCQSGGVGSRLKRNHCRLPRRFIAMQPLFLKFLARHKKCPFQTLLRHHCFYTKWGARFKRHNKKKTLQRIIHGTKRKLPHKALQKRVKSRKPLLSQDAIVNVLKYRHAVSKHTSHNQVERFLQCICHKVVPKEVWGTYENKMAFLCNLGKFIRLRRAEKFSLNQMMKGIKVSKCDWLKPNGRSKEKHCIPVTESMKQLELLAKFIWWFVTQYLMVLLKSFFYITESVHRQRMFYYRKCVWRTIHQFGMETFCGKFFQQLRAKDAEKLLSNRTSLGFSSLRFLPKASTIRPITNMKNCFHQKEPVTSQKPQSINKKLQNLFEVIKFEKEHHPNKVGASLLGVDELYKMLKDYVEQRKKFQEKPLYFVSVDVNHCYESIVLQKLYDVMKEVFVEEEYLIRRFTVLRMSAGKVCRQFMKDVTTADDCVLFPDFLQSRIKAQELKAVIAVDQVWYASEDRSKLLNILQQHIFNNIVKIGNQYFQQTRGIPQGSVLSPLLCSYFYGHMEKMHLSEVSQDPESLLLRWVDDFLLITPAKDLAEKFLTIMHAGIPDYGCHINHEKTLTNFAAITADGSKVKMIDSHRKFPFCGYLIDPQTLEVCCDMIRYTGLLLRDTLTVSLDAHPGYALRRKLQHLVRPKCHPIFLDHNLNSRDTVVFNVYQAFLLAAFKFHAYIKELPKGGQPKDNPSFFCRIILDLAEYFYRTSARRCRQLSRGEVKVSLDESQVTWLCLRAFWACLRRKQSRYKILLKFIRNSLSRLVVEDFRRIVDPARHAVFKMLH